MSTASVTSPIVFPARSSVSFSAAALDPITSFCAGGRAANAVIVKRKGEKGTPRQDSYLMQCPAILSRVLDGPRLQDTLPKKICNS